ncbi:hypothetical protein [Streptococcus sciuri]|uniref:Uncharacterized protein n=1 Tax=Streptococcus sciuri TaxID=2973939 RepID=A0ABT2F563_9STRE|nr:hypothetical protein [Streptococcus sciuri]MCS4487552.1 hypothetical protein [Streptococcus sciuri]
MKRNINEDLIDALNDICRNTDDSPVFWKKFYNWCILSYQQERDKRFSVSDLGNFLLSRNVDNTREIIVAYIHVLYSLAMFEGEEIYGDGFII